MNGVQAPQDGRVERGSVLHQVIIEPYKVQSPQHLARANDGTGAVRPYRP